MTRFVAVPLALVALQASITPLPAPLRAEIARRAWHPGCPVPLSRFGVLTVRRWGFDGRAHRGQLVVDQVAAAPLRRVFDRLYRLRFPIRKMSLGDAYGTRQGDPDNTAAFSCRRVTTSPCPGARPSHTWSQHAYGLAVDVNPIENPFVGGCGRTRTRASVRYLDRSRVRRGMVTPAVVEAFRSIGWGWGGDWRTRKDYMHFSANGR